MSQAIIPQGAEHNVNETLDVSTRVVVGVLFAVICLQIIFQDRLKEDEEKNGKPDDEGKLHFRDSGQPRGQALLSFIGFWIVTILTNQTYFTGDCIKGFYWDGHLLMALIIIPQAFFNLRVALANRNNKNGQELRILNLLMGCMVFLIIKEALVQYDIQTDVYVTKMMMSGEDSQAQGIASIVFLCIANGIPHLFGLCLGICATCSGDVYMEGLLPLLTGGKASLAIIQFKSGEKSEEVMDEETGGGGNKILPLSFELLFEVIPQICIQIAYIADGTCTFSNVGGFDTRWFSVIISIALFLVDGWVVVKFCCGGSKVEMWPEKKQNKVEQEAEQENDKEDDPEIGNIEVVIVKKEN